MLQVYPLIGAMSLVTGMCVFQLTRNVFLNPDVRSVLVKTTRSIIEHFPFAPAHTMHTWLRLTEPRFSFALLFRVSKSNRQSAVLENAEEGERYSQHAFRRFVSAHSPEVFPAINRFFSGFAGK